MCSDVPFWQNRVGAYNEGNHFLVHIFFWCAVEQNQWFCSLGVYALCGLAPQDITSIANCSVLIVFKFLLENGFHKRNIFFPQIGQQPNGF